mmetsp:Transcript_31475/g.50639  ORF Transcript_31475/g.50639 Transcript_31475/m.50639 type:complete len:441 (-) Transcript_31475:19-1341(-)
MQPRQHTLAQHAQGYMGCMMMGNDAEWSTLIDSDLEQEHPNETFQGKRIALVGQASSGKRTLKALILRAYDEQYDPLHNEEELALSIMNSICTACYQNMKGLLQQLNMEKSSEYAKLNNVNIHADARLAFTSGIGQILQDLWTKPEIKQAYLRRVATDTASIYSRRTFENNMAYWFDKMEQLKHASYRLTFDDYLRARVRRPAHALMSMHMFSDIDGLNERQTLYQDECGNNYALLDHEEDRFQNASKGLAETFKYLTSQHAAFFVCALSEYVSNGGRSGVIQSLSLFYSLCKLHLFPPKVFVVFTKMDIFKQFLRDQPLSCCDWNEIREEYKGRNFCVKPKEICRAMKQILALLMVSQENSELYLAIPIDVVALMYSYSASVQDAWLDVVCQDGVEFAKQIFVRSASSADFAIDLEFCATNGFDLDVVKTMMDCIHTAI